jgi:hypothetical protein
MRIVRSTANTRMWPSGSTALSLSGSTSSAVLRFSTQHELSCGICANCFGRVYFQYGTSVSDPIDITTTAVESAVSTAIAGMEDLAAAMWTNLAVSVDSSDGSNRICSTTTAVTTTIELRSDYGNLPFLTLFDASYLDTTTTNPANLTMRTNAAVDKVYECSNQGTCDYSAGQCQCYQSVLAGGIKYRADSSDGKTCCRHWPVNPPVLSSHWWS